MHPGPPGLRKPGCDQEGHKPGEAVTGRTEDGDKTMSRALTHLTHEYLDVLVTQTLTQAQKGRR